MVFRLKVFFTMMIIFMPFYSLLAQTGPDNEAFLRHVTSSQPEALYYPVTEASLNITHTAMDYTLDPNVREISGYVTHHFHVTEETQSIMLRLAEELTPTSVTTTFGTVTIDHNGYDLEISFPNIIQPYTDYDVTINYSGTPPDNGFYLQDYHNETPVLATFAEPYGAGDWWPCNPGLSDKIDSLDIKLTFPEQYLAGANGLLMENIDNGDGTRTMHFQHRYPIVNYNVAFAISDYIAFNDEVTVDEDTFFMENLTWEDDLWIAQNTTESIIPVFQMLSDYFGDYPFKDEKYGHMQWTRGGAMEHQTMTSTCCWSYELMVHELGHQWFGNMVTLDTWHDIFLNEGFATYISGLAYEKFFPEKDYWERWKREKREHIITEPGGSVYVEDTTDVSRIFDARLSYNKGAMILHMLRTLIGDEAFFRGVQDYLYHPDNLFGFASMESFIESMEMAADTSLTEFFDDWYYGEGYPTYTIEYTPGCSALFSVIFHQETSHSSVDFFEMPVSLHLKSSYADTIVTFNNVENHEYFLVPLEFCVEEVVFDPGNNLVAGPPTYLTGLTEADLSNRFTVSPNPVTDKAIIRWEGIEVQELNIYHMDGRRIYSERIPMGTTEIVYDNKLKSRGLCLFELKTNEHSINKKVIIK